VTAAPARIVAFVPDLMDRSKVAAAAEGQVRFLATPGDLVTAATEADLVIVDLGRPALLAVLGEVVAGGARVVAFGSHVDRDTLAAARLAGCHDVLARSEFFTDIAHWLT